VIDLGGGDGTLLALIATAHADMSGILFDQALAAQVAHRTLATAGVADRITVCSGDFFESVPQGGDLYLLKSVIHDWDDANAVRILETCRRAMADSARLLVIERVVPEGPEPAEAKLFDINMLVMTGGCERTEAEHVALLAKAGFTHARTITTASPLSLIEAIPVA
jgi:predicted O-methyltransferase YrrM